MKQINLVIKILFCGISYYKMNDNIDKFWSEHTAFSYKNVPFDDDDLIWNSKDIREVNSHIWHHKYSLPYTHVSFFFSM